MELIDGKSENKDYKVNIFCEKDETGHYLLLPFHGTHQRAVSVVEFCPCREDVNDDCLAGSIGHGNGLSFNNCPSNKGIFSSININNVLCASASVDGIIKIWNITHDIFDGESIQPNNISFSSSETPQDRNNSLTYSKPEENLTVSNVQNFERKNVLTHISNFTKSKIINPLVTIVGHAQGINDLAWSPHTGYFLASACDDNSVRLWDLTRSNNSSILAGSNSVHSNSICINKNDGFVCSSLVEFRGHSNFCFSVQFSPRGNILCSGSFDETIKMWDVRSGKCVSTIPAHSDPVTAVDFNFDGRCIVSSSFDGLIRIWDVSTSECLKTLYAEGNPPVSFVRYSPNGKFILSGSLDGKLRLWNVFNSDIGRAEYTCRTSHNKTRYESMGDCLGCASRGGKCTRTYSGGHVNTKYSIFSDFVVSNPKQQAIVTGSEDGRVCIYDLQTRIISQLLPNVHIDSVLAVSAHRSSDIICTGGMSIDRSVRFWAPRI